MSILSILSLVLVSLSSEVGQVWTRSQDENAYRLHARAVLDYMGRELRCASLAVNSSVAATAGKSTLQFLINPSVGSGYNYPDNIFWQAPIATDDKSRGVMAEIGYFIRWDGNQPNLCRYFVNPTDTANYLIYTAAPAQWITGSGNPGSLDNVASSDQAHNFQGLFLENVLGLWIQAYPFTEPTATPVAFTLPYDSSSAASASHPLPAYVVISIVVMDVSSAVRLQNNSSMAATIKSLSSASTDPQSFVAALPNSLKNAVNIVSIKVVLDNYR